MPAWRILLVVAACLAWNGGSIVALHHVGFFDLPAEHILVQALAVPILIGIALANIKIIEWCLYVGDRPGRPLR